MKVSANSIITMIECGCLVTLSEKFDAITFVKMKFLTDTDKVYLVSFNMDGKDVVNKELNKADLEMTVKTLVNGHHDNLTLSCIE